MLPRGRVKTWKLRRRMSLKTEQNKCTNPHYCNLSFTEYLVFACSNKIAVHIFVHKSHSILNTNNFFTQTWVHLCFIVIKNSVNISLLGI